VVAHPLFQLLVAIPAVTPADLQPAQSRTHWITAAMPFEESPCHGAICVPLALTLKMEVVARKRDQDQLATFDLPPS
jgi:hypothetical protein